MIAKSHAQAIKQISRVDSFRLEFQQQSLRLQQTPVVDAQFFQCHAVTEGGELTFNIQCRTVDELIIAARAWEAEEDANFIDSAWICISGLGAMSSIAVLTL